MNAGASDDDPSRIATLADGPEPGAAGRLRLLRHIVISTLTGISINLIGPDSVKALVWTAAVNGVAPVPLMTVMMVVATSPRVMGGFRLPPGLCFMGWLCTAAMAANVVATFITW